MEKREQLYEGKAKKVFATSDPNVVIVSYKDDATAFNGLKKGTIESKGIIKDNGDHKFRPDDAVTRVELAKFIYYAYK